MTVPHPGGAFGPYDLEAELGRGGMGVVFRARERASGRPVALKVLHDRPSAADRERFRREAELAAALVHPGIVRVHAAGEVQGVAYFACELVEGARDLARAARDLPPLARAALVRDAARALGHAHARGVVHRDVKPDNVLVDAEGRVRVADFGVATAASLERLTRTGAAVGTPRYMAPEQIDARREEVGPPTDVWALGMTLFEVVAGAHPFADAGSIADLFNRIVNRASPDLAAHAAEAPRALADVVGRALQKEPRDRYPDAGALADDLDRVVAGGLGAASEARRARQTRRAAAALVCVAGVVGLALALRARAETAVATGTAPAATEAAPAVAVTPRLEVDPAPDGWRLLGPDEEALVVRGEAAGRRVVARVNGTTVTDAALPLRVPVAAGAFVRVEVELRGAGAAPIETSVAALRLPADLTLVELPGGARAARAGDGSLLLLVPPPTTGLFDRPALRSGNKSEAPGAPSRFGELLPEGQDAARRGRRLDHPFLLGEREVTQGQLRGATDGTRDLPAVEVRRDHAAEHAATLGLVLPTLDEWLWAARGGEEGRPFPWGQARGRELANFDDEDDPTDRVLAPVGSSPGGAGRWGHLDLVGNASEWVVDEGADGMTRGLAMGGSFRDPWPPQGEATTLRFDGAREHAEVSFRLAWRPARP